MLLGVRHSGYIVSDIEVSRKFYETVLGFEVMQAFEDNSDYINNITCTSGAVVRMVKMKSPDGSVIEILSSFSLLDLRVYISIKRFNN